MHECINAYDQNERLNTDENVKYWEKKAIIMMKHEQRI